MASCHLKNKMPTSPGPPTPANLVHLPTTGTLFLLPNVLSSSHLRAFRPVIFFLEYSACSSDDCSLPLLPPQLTVTSSKGPPLTAPSPHTISSSVHSALMVSLFLFLWIPCLPAQPELHESQGCLVHSTPNDWQTPGPWFPLIEYNQILYSTARNAESLN